MMQIYPEYIDEAFDVEHKQLSLMTNGSRRNKGLVKIQTMGQLI
jgi:hypothetical protein